LGLSAQVYEAYDDDVLASSTGSGSNRPPASAAAGQSGFYSAFGVGLLYSHRGDSSSFRSWANSGAAYYPDQSELSAIYHQLGLSLSAPLGSRVNLYVSSFADYRPRYSLQPIPLLEVPEPDPALAVSAGTAAPAPDIDYTIVPHESYRYGGNAGLHFSLTGRLNLGVDYGRVQTTSSDGLTDMQVQGGGAALRYKLTRNASLKAGYSRREATFEGLVRLPSVTEHINVGIDYHKALSITRTTQLRFGSGSAIAQDNRGRRRLEAIGSASLVHQFKRTWAAQSEYRRDVGYIEGFSQPVFSDSVSAGVGGLVSRRVEFSADARYLNGTSGFHYEFDEGVRPPGLPPTYSRNGVRVGLSLWVPLVGRK
jgi:hypothetical protein